MSSSSPTTLVFAISLGLAGWTLLVPSASGQEQHPIASQVGASLKDPLKPFTLLINIQAKEEAGAKLEGAVATAAVPTRKEKGCLAYDLSRDTKSPTQYVLYERWQNLAALDAHLKTDYITTLLKELGEFASSSEIRVLVPAGD